MINIRITTIYIIVKIYFLERDKLCFYYDGTLFLTK
jgi:hypothetical protein